MTEKEFEESLKQAGISGYEQPQIAKGKNGSSLGFAFALFANKDDAGKAVKSTGTNFGGRAARIEVALDEKAREENRRKHRTSLFVGNAPKTVVKEDLAKLFDGTEFTEIVVIPPKTADHKGFAFVRFSTPESAASALDKVKGSKLNEVELLVEFARPSRRFSGRRSATAGRPGKQPSTTGEQKPRQRKGAPRNTDRPKDEHVVFAGNLPFAATEKDLMEFFKEYHPERAEVITRPRGGSRGFGFVHFKEVEDAAKAIALDKKEMMKREIHCAISYKKEETQQSESK